MKFKQKTISIFIIVLSILVLSCHQKKSKWQGTIEEVDGVTVIKNPVEPMYGAEIIEIEEDLAIREEPSDDGLKFEMLVMLCIDDDGNIYVVKAEIYKTGNLWGEKIVQFLINREQNFEIDTEFDFWINELMLREKLKRND